MNKEELKLFTIIFAILFAVMSALYVAGTWVFSAPIVAGGFYVSAGSSFLIDVLVCLFIKNCVNVQ